MNCKSVKEFVLDVAHACVCDACRRMRPRMCAPSFQAHPGIPPVGGGATRDRYSSTLALSSNYYYRSPAGKSGGDCVNRRRAIVELKITIYY